MANPDFIDESVTDQGGAGPFTVSFPAAWAAGQIAVLFVATDGFVPTLSTPNGFVIAQDPAGNSASVVTGGTIGGGAECGMFMFWKRLVGSTTTTDPAPVVAAAPGGAGGTVMCMHINTYSNCRASGTPFHKIVTGTLLTASAAITWPDATSTLAGCTWLTAAASANDDQTFNSCSFSGAASPTGQLDNGWHNGSGNSCAFVGGRGGYATAGGPHHGTGTFGASTKQALITAVLASNAELASATGNESVTLVGSSSAIAGAVSLTGTEAGALSPSAAASAGGVTVTGTEGATLGASIAASAGSTITVTGNESGSSSASVANSAGTVSTGPLGTEAGTLAPSLLTATGTIAVSGSEGAQLAGSALASAGSVSLTGNASAASGGSTAAITGAVTSPTTLAMGKVAIRQKANTTAPNSGTLTTFPVYPAWQASHAYLLQDAIRVTNAGKIYELQSDGTSASSGGPTTTAQGITDGTAHWNFLGNGNGAMDTQTAGSFFVATVAWGRDATGGGVPSDNKGNSWSQLQKNFYASFPSSSQAIFAAAQPAAGGTGHTISDAFGLGNDGGGDEITAILAEVIGGTHIQDRSYVERATSTSNVVTSAPVTTTGPAILIAFWWLNGTVRAGGTNHDAIPGSGFVEIPEGRALMEIGPGGAGEVQVTTHMRSVASAGTFTASITTTSGEGSAVYLIAIQGVAGITGNAASSSSASVANSAGTVSTPRTGTEAGALSPSAAASAGSVSITANSGGANSGASSGAASGAVAVTGSGSTTLGASIASSTGTLVPILTGTESGTLAPSVAASFGTVFSGVGGTAGNVLAGSTGTAIGTVRVTGASANANDASVPNSSASVLVLGSGSARNSDSRASIRGTVGDPIAPFRRLVGVLSSTGQMFGLLQLEGVSMIDLIGPMTVYQGDDVDLLLTITDDAGARVDLTGFAIELQVKPALGGADPPTIAKALGSGITMLDQGNPLTKGQATVSITSGETSVAARLYWLDAVTIDLLGGRRSHVVAPREFTIAAVVNQP